MEPASNTIDQMKYCEFEFKTRNYIMGNRFISNTDRFYEYDEENTFVFHPGSLDWDLFHEEDFKEPVLPKKKHMNSPFTPLEMYDILSDPLRKFYIADLFLGAREIPVYPFKMDKGVSKPLVGAIPQKMETIAEEGDYVAALMQTVEFERMYWMLAIVMDYSHEDDTYNLSNADAIASDIFYTVSYHRVISLARYRANPEIAAHALHKIGERVMAVCPGTTFFLIGIVKGVPATSRDDYLVELLHPDFNGGRSNPQLIPQLFVVSLGTPIMKIYDKY